MTAAAAPVREYHVRAHSTPTFGRVLASARQHHFVVDGPIQNGCPGEEVTPVELFLAAVASCAAELIPVIAREDNVRVGDVSVAITGSVDRSRQPRSDLTLFTRVQIEIVLADTDGAQAAALVEGFKRR